MINDNDETLMDQPGASMSQLIEPFVPGGGHNI